MPDPTRETAVAVVGMAASTPPRGYVESSLGGTSAWIRKSAGHPGCHPDLALLLRTSGSTGNPKLVRLARSAVLVSPVDGLRMVSLTC
jgi:long-subunit acyl-CoA synthetase (AMP-forming)